MTFTTSEHYTWDDFDVGDVVVFWSGCKKIHGIITKMKMDRMHIHWEFDTTKTKFSQYEFKYDCIFCKLSDWKKFKKSMKEDF